MVKEKHEVYQGGGGENCGCAQNSRMPRALLWSICRCMNLEKGVQAKHSPASFRAAVAPEVNIKRYSLLHSVPTKKLDTR